MLLLIVGCILGIAIMLLVFYALLLKGQNAAYAGQMTKLAKEQAAAEIAIGRFAAVEQERIRIRESISVNFSDEQVTMFADKVSRRCQTIMDAQAAANRLKMN